MMFRFSWLIVFVIAMLLPACGPAAPELSTSSTPASTIDRTGKTAAPPSSGVLNTTELKYRVLEQFPDFFFCDPDFYPVAREDEADLAQQRFPELQTNSEEFETILERSNLSGQAAFTGDQKLLIYRAHKKIAAVPFTNAGSGYQFQIQVAKTEGSGEMINGVIDLQGNITIQERTPSFATCPICLAAGTLIDTPEGPVPVQQLKHGDMVWTIGHAGLRVAAPVAQVGSTPAQANHQVVHLVLNDARSLWVSPGHPTADGRIIRDLRVGDMLDGSLVQSVDRVLYQGSATFDLLPAGETGLYWANGILIASTYRDTSPPPGVSSH